MCHSQNEVLLTRRGSSEERVTGRITCARYFDKKQTRKVSATSANPHYQQHARVARSTPSACLFIKKGKTSFLIKSCRFAELISPQSLHQITKVKLNLIRTAEVEITKIVSFSAHHHANSFQRDEVRLSSVRLNVMCGSMK